MTVIMIQSKLKAESVADVQAAITKMLIAAGRRATRRGPLRVAAAARRPDVGRPSAGRRRQRKSAHRSAGVPGTPGNRRAGAG